MNTYKYLNEHRLKAMDFSSSYVPEHTRAGIINFIERGIPPGGFLSAVINNNLKEAFGRADGTNAAHLRSIVCWFYNYAPMDCWGNANAVAYWLNKLEHDKQEGQVA